ncbi:MAG: type IX secretion system protein PorQ, partial [Bacteroidota bacterium]
MKKLLSHFVIPAFGLFLGTLFINPTHVNAQTQSGRVYEFINLPSTARITALGGYAVPAFDNDLGMALFYPSLMSRKLPRQLSLNFVDYFGDISFGTAAMNYGFGKAGDFSLAVQYISYGSFIHADEFGNTLGEFSAAEYSVNIGWGRRLTEKFSIGSNIKTIMSSMEEYSSFGLAADISVSYFDPDRLIASSLVFRNIGRQITTYHSNEREQLPFDIVLGVSKKLINAPLRFSFVAHNLHNWDLTYEDPVPSDQITIGADNEQTTSQERFNEFSDQLLRHMVFGVEFLPSENFFLGIGYNYR